MAVLLLRLAAPLQSWGCGSKFNIRSTEREPTKSGVIGMIAAALGIKRDEPEKLRPLSELRFGIRVEREGKLLRDFHMVSCLKKPDVTERYYLQDAVFLAALESEDKDYLNSLAKALQNPVYPLYLGRRSCPPTLPVVVGIRDGGLTEVLDNEPRICDRADKDVRIVYETYSEGTPVQDKPVSFSQLHRKHDWRLKQEKIILSEEHDPFSEL